MKGVANATSDAQLVTLHQIIDSVEAFSICEEPALLSLHYTLPASEVLLNTSSFAAFDIANNDLPDEVGAGVTINASDVRVGKTLRISIAFDIAKVDEQTAAEFMKHTKEFLEDPELMLL